MCDCTNQCGGTCVLTHQILLSCCKEKQSYWCGRTDFAILKHCFKYEFFQQDDDAIISWHWDLTSGPIGYQPPLQDGPTLVLHDLKQPGNYTFKLTVEDSDHVKNSTAANITVLNHTDYPPEANAGIIHANHNHTSLPHSIIIVKTTIIIE